MKPGRYKVFSSIIITFLVLLCCEPLHADEKSIPVFVSIFPQAYFVERIGRNRVTVHVLVLPGKNPATYAPSPAQMSKLAKAEIFFRIGVPFEEALMPKINNSTRQLQIIDTRKGIQLRKMARSHHGDEEAHEKHRPRAEHHPNDGYDPHIWLSPILVKKQAETIYEALVKADPAGRTQYLSNYKAFVKDLETLHQKIKKSLAPVKGETLFVFHPAFGYFADAYGLKQMAVEMEGKAPKGKDLTLFIKKAKKEAVRIVFVQPQFDKRTAQKIAHAIQGAVVMLDPLAGDYIHNLEDMATKVSDALNDAPNRN